MNAPNGTLPEAQMIDTPKLRATQDAFDSVAADYDGPRGNNELIQDMRREMWRWLDSTFAPASRLIDIGCGTGLDAIRMARMGHRVTATDWSPRMMQRTGERAASERLTERVQALPIGAHELQRLPGAGTYDGAYSNLGPLNCVPDLGDVARECARLLKPNGALVFTVIGRICPWELAHFLRRRQWTRAKVRFGRAPMAVGMNKHTVWTRYYGPREFYRAFAQQFELAHYRGLCLFAPPPYLTTIRERHLRWYERFWTMDRHVAGWPVLRELGDHFLMVLKKR